MNTVNFIKSLKINAGTFKLLNLETFFWRQKMAYPFMASWDSVHL